MCQSLCRAAERVNNDKIVSGRDKTHLRSYGVVQNAVAAGHELQVRYKLSRSGCRPEHEQGSIFTHFFVVCELGGA